MYTVFRQGRLTMSVLYFSLFKRIVPVSDLRNPQPLPVPVVEGGEAGPSHAAVQERTLDR